jgi:hypothetical protein
VVKKVAAMIVAEVEELCGLQVTAKVVGSKVLSHWEILGVDDIVAAVFHGITASRMG